MSSPSMSLVSIISLITPEHSYLSLACHQVPKCSFPSLIPMCTGFFRKSHRPGCPSPTILSIQSASTSVCLSRQGIAVVDLLHRELRNILEFYGGSLSPIQCARHLGADGGSKESSSVCRPRGVPAWWRDAMWQRSDCCLALCLAW